jgi:hypothetical protein
MRGYLPRMDGVVAQPIRLTMPARIIAPWVLGALALGALLLGGALLVALTTAAGPHPYLPTFADDTAGMVDVGRIFVRNALVLALNTMVCIAIYLATRPPASPAQERAGALALSVIAGLTLFAFTSMTWRLGHDMASAAQTLGLTSPGLVVRLSVHAVPELTALFLPLAACLSLCRRGRHDDLAAAGLVCAGVALPLVALCAYIEVYVTRLAF